MFQRPSKVHKYQYTQHTLFFLFFWFFNFLILIFYFYEKQIKQIWKQPKQKHERKQTKHKTRCICMRRRVREKDHSKEITPMFWRRNSNYLLSKGLMNKSAFWSSVWMNLRVRVPLSTSSRMKWCPISMCLDRECWTRFLEILMALVLS